MLLTQGTGDEWILELIMDNSPFRIIFREIITPLTCKTPYPSTRTHTYTHTPFCFFLEKQGAERQAKMVGQKDPKITSPQGHPKITNIYRTTIN